MHLFSALSLTKEVLGKKLKLRSKIGYFKMTTLRNGYFYKSTQFNTLTLWETMRIL